jgi:hypothetical protein
VAPRLYNKGSANKLIDSSTLTVVVHNQTKSIMDSDQVFTNEHGKVGQVIGAGSLVKYKGLFYH